MIRLHRIFFNTVCLMLTINLASAQNGKKIEGYTFETGNRGYLSQVEIQIVDMDSEQILSTVTSEVSGKFIVDLPPVSKVKLTFTKDMFKENIIEVDLIDDKTFVKVEMERSPGYQFEITLADKKKSEEEVVDGIRGALVEVYNNTTDRLVLKLENHPHPEFKLGLKKGNHYTILVRKKGYLAKQMEAFVNVKGCILCFEGINDVKPGVTDNLTSGNEYGTLLANVEMDKIYSGKSFEVKDIYYDLNSAKLKPESKKELDKVINVLRYNPNLTLELGSHTDSRGKDDFNMELSEQRAKSAVEYIKEVGGIPKYRIISAGYGETLLLNKCADGVNCTEKEHAINRRSAIKIVGIDKEWIFKPLVNIKNEIKMEKELQAMINGESKQLTEQEYKALKAKEAKLKEAQEDPNDIKEAMELAEKSIYDQKRKSLEISKTKTDQKINKEKNQVKDSTEKEVEIIETEIIKNADEKVDDTIEKEKPSTPIKVDDMPNDKIIDIKPNNNTLPTDGYKIVIHYSGTPLNKENPLFDKHQNLETYISPEKYYYYMLPGYKSNVEAEQALKKGLIAAYPSGYVVGFKGGRRIL